MPLTVQILLGSLPIRNDYHAKRVQCIPVANKGSVADMLTVTAGKGIAEPGLFSLRAFGPFLRYLSVIHLCNSFLRLCNADAYM